MGRTRGRPLAWQGLVASGDSIMETGTSGLGLAKIGFYVSLETDSSNVPGKEDTLILAHWKLYWLSNIQSYKTEKWYLLAW